MGVPVSPLADPPVKDVVEVHVGEQRRQDSSDTMGNFEFEVALSYVKGEKRGRKVHHSE